MPDFGRTAVRRLHQQHGLNQVQTRTQQRVRNFQPAWMTCQTGKKRIVHRHPEQLAYRQFQSVYSNLTAHHARFVLNQLVRHIGITLHNLFYLREDRLDFTLR